MISFTCPGCHATFKLPDEVAGKTARCSKCNQRFTVPAGNGQPVAAVVAAAPKSAPAPVSTGPKKVALKPVSEALVPDVVEVVDEPAVAPRRSPKPLDDVEVVETADQVEVVDDDDAISERKPPVRARRNDDDDDDDSPRRIKRKRSKSGSSTGLIVGLIVGGLVLVGGIVVVVVLVVNRSVQPPANAGMPPEVKFNVVAGGQPGGNAAPGVILDKQDQLTRNDPFDTVQRNCRCKRYTVQLEANKSYRIDMMATNRFGAFDAFVRVEQNGQTLAWDDDGAAAGDDDSLDAQLFFRPTQTGAYVIVATSFVPLQTGSYRLTVTQQP